jgi:hypothetical protein
MALGRLLPIAALSSLALAVPATPALAHTSVAKHHGARHHKVSRHHRRRRLAAHIAVVSPNHDQNSSPTAIPAIPGVTYYVSPSGSDSNSGASPAQAWKTVGRVNRASLNPGDGVLFQGGATFSDADLEPSTSGTSAKPIVFASYGSGQAVLSAGVWFVQNDLTFDDLQLGSTFFGGSAVHGPSDHGTLENCSISLPAGNSKLGVYTNGDNWVIDNNTISGTGLSGMLLNGNGYTISGNTIDNTGLDTSVTYNAHGIYLDASNATITKNRISNFAESGISARYRNSTITNNHISGGQIGIDFYQTDPATGTSDWTGNTISATTAAGIYVSPAGVYSTHESFVITSNTLRRASGVYTNLHSTRGNYKVAHNALG